MQHYHNDHYGQPPKGTAWRPTWKATSAFDVTLYQRGENGRFAVVYGKEVHDGLTYSEATGRLGQALMHALACEGLIGYDGP